MLHRLYLAVLLALLSLVMGAPGAHAGSPIWQDTVFASGREGQADAIVSDGSSVYAGGFVATASAEIALIRSYAAQTGALLWEDRPSQPDGGFFEVSSLALDGGRLFATVFATGASGQEWTVRAYDAHRGVLLWDDVREDDGEAVQVAASGGRVFVAGTGITDGATPTFLVRSYDAASGAALWEHAPADAASGPGFVRTASAGRVVVAAPIAGTAQVSALAQDDGRILWTATGPALPDLTSAIVGLAVAGGRAVVATRLGATLDVRAYDVATGALLWQQSELGPGSAVQIAEVGLASDGDLVVAGYAQGKQRLVAWAAASGAPRWRNEDAGVSRDLQIVGDRVLGVGGSLVRAFALESGVPRWSSGIGPDASGLALAGSGTLAFVAGVAGPGFGTFHVAAFDTTARDRVVAPIVPRAGRLPIVR